MLNVILKNFNSDWSFWLLFLWQSDVRRTVRVHRNINSGNISFIQIISSGNCMVHIIIWMRSFWMHSHSLQMQSNTANEIVNLAQCSIQPLFSVPCESLYAVLMALWNREIHKDWIEHRTWICRVESTEFNTIGVWVWWQPTSVIITNSMGKIDSLSSQQNAKIKWEKIWKRICRSIHPSYISPIFLFFLFQN